MQFQMLALVHEAQHFVSVSPEHRLLTVGGVFQMFMRARGGRLTAALLECQREQTGRVQGGAGQERKGQVGIFLKAMLSFLLMP